MSLSLVEQTRYISLHSCISYAQSNLTRHFMVDLLRLEQTRTTALKTYLANSKPWQLVLRPVQADVQCTQNLGILLFTLMTRGGAREARVRIQIRHLYSAPHVGLTYPALPSNCSWKTLTALPLAAMPKAVSATFHQLAPCNAFNGAEGAHARRSAHYQDLSAVLPSLSSGTI